MEFDKSRVYTALNADEIKIGSNVIVASNIGDLKGRVALYNEGNDRFVTVITSIQDERYADRFVIGTVTDKYVSTNWPFAYLVSEPDAIRCADLNIGDVVTDGISELMVLGVDRVNDEVFLPRLEWVSDADLTRYYKKVDDDL